MVSTFFCLHCNALLEFFDTLIPLIYIHPRGIRLRLSSMTIESSLRVESSCPCPVGGNPLGRHIGSGLQIFPYAMGRNLVLSIPSLCQHGVWSQRQFRGCELDEKNLRHDTTRTSQQASSDATPAATAACVLEPRSRSVFSTSSVCLLIGQSNPEVKLVPHTNTLSPLLVKGFQARATPGAIGQKEAHGFVRNNDVLMRAGMFGSLACSLYYDFQF